MASHATSAGELVEMTRPPAAGGQPGTDCPGGVLEPPPALGSLFIRLAWTAHALKRGRATGHDLVLV